MNTSTFGSVVVDEAGDAARPSGSRLPALDTRAPGDLTLAQRLKQVHETLRRRDDFAPLQRIAIATYDASTDTIKTFVDSNVGASPFRHYEVPLSQLGSLSQAARMRVVRVVDAMTD